MTKFNFETIHPDSLIAREVVIDCLLGTLAESRAALERALDYNAVTPNGIGIKNTVRNALAQTSDESIHSKLYVENCWSGR